MYGASFAATRGLVRTILEHPHGRPWVLRRYGQALRLHVGEVQEDGRGIMLHVWMPDEDDRVVDLHTHRLPMRSLVVSGVLEQHRYVEDAAGAVYRCLVYPQEQTLENAREVRLREGPLERYERGDAYEQGPDEVHRSMARYGAVTLVEWGEGEAVWPPRMFWPPSADEQQPWVGRKLRPATPDEIAEYCEAALAAW